MTHFLEELAQACEYDPEGDGSVDDLIAYKDALEDLVYRAEAQLEQALRDANNEVEKDDDKWASLAVGQDTEEAEHSGVLIGTAEGLELALEILRGTG